MAAEPSSNSISNTYIGQDSQTAAEVRQLCVSEAAIKLFKANGKEVPYTVAENSISTVNNAIAANSKVVAGKVSQTPPTAGLGVKSCVLHPIDKCASQICAARESWVALCSMRVTGDVGPFIAGVLLVFAATLAFVGVAERFCPPEFLTSGMCTVSWYRTVESAALCTGAALGAFATVAMPSFLAPTHKSRVAATAFSMGAIDALWFLASASAPALPPLASALAAGMAAAGWVSCERQIAA